MNRSSHSTYDGIAARRPRICGVQCRRCRVRLSGPLAGWRSARALPDYQQIPLCNACRDELQARAPSKTSRRQD